MASCLRAAGAALVAEVNTSGTILRRYVPGPTMDEPVVWYEGSGTTTRRFLQADERGSIVAISNASGTVVQINTYDEYGTPGAGNIGRFQYTGQIWFAEAGLYNYKARFYSPYLGRFLQTDPIGYGDGLNRYGYVGNDPINFIDPSGLERLCNSRPANTPSRGGNSNVLETVEVVGAFIPDCIDIPDPPLLPIGPIPMPAMPVVPQTQQPVQEPVEPPCTDGPGYGERYVNWTSDNFIEPGAAASLLLLGVWPKSLAPATGGRPPLLGSTNPLTSVPRAVGVPGAGSRIARTGAAGIGLATMFVGTYDATIAVTGLLYAIPNYGDGSCKKSN